MFGWIILIALVYVYWTIKYKHRLASPDYYDTRWTAAIMGIMAALTAYSIYSIAYDLTTPGVKW
jgi:hypothetical protein